MGTFTLQNRETKERFRGAGRRGGNFGHKKDEKKIRLLSRNQNQISAARNTMTKWGGLWRTGREKNQLNVFNTWQRPSDDVIELARSSSYLFSIEFNQLFASTLFNLWRDTYERRNHATHVVRGKKRVLKRRRHSLEVAHLFQSRDSLPPWRGQNLCLLCHFAMTTRKRVPRESKKKVLTTQQGDVGFRSDKMRTTNFFAL